MPFPILAGKAITDTTYEVANSCRFDKAGTAYMHKSQGTPSSRRTFTYSGWIKLGLQNIYQIIFESADGSHNFQIVIQDDSNNNDLRIYDYDGSTNLDLRTSQAFRDHIGWYHVCVAIDTTQSTASNRAKLYINGTRVTAFDTETYPDQNYDTAFVANKNIQVGRQQSGSDYFDGYMAEVCFIDGSALAPTSFGEFNEDSPNIWQPIDVSGLTFGTNGFYLDFEASDNLGNDANGGTDLTEVNLAAEDQASDSPTNNFCTLDPNASSPTITFSQGNCRHQNNSGNDQGSVGTFAVSTGKWYWEVKCVDRPEVGILTDTDRNVLPDNTVSPNAMLEVAGIVNSFGNGNDMRFNGATIDTNLTTSLADNDILSVAVDVDNEKIWFGKNGTWMNSGDPAAGSNEIKDFSDADTRFVTPFHNITTGNTDILEYNFGGCSAFTVSSANNDGDGYGNFEYSVPSGFYSLCTKNLAEYG